MKPEEKGDYFIHNPASGEIFVNNEGAIFRGIVLAKSSYGAKVEISLKNAKVVLSLRFSISEELNRSVPFLLFKKKQYNMLNCFGFCGKRNGISMISGISQLDRFCD